MTDDLPIYSYRYKWEPSTHPKHIGPMAQEVAEKFPDKVFAGPDGFLCVKLDDLPAGITAHDLARPVHPVEHAAAMWRWEKVFEHWRKKA